MADKVQKIREEVEKLMYGFNLEADIASCEDAETEKLADIKYLLCKKILDYIDNVQKEPVSDDLLVAANKAWQESEDKESYAETFVEGFIACFNWQKRKDSTPSKDLEELINTLSKRYPEVSFAKLSRIAVRVAKWQKEQMMAKAVDGIARPDDNEIWCNLTSNNLEDGDKVKVIIIKED